MVAIFFTLCYNQVRQILLFFYKFLLLNKNNNYITYRGKFIVDENTSVNVDLMNLIATVPVVKNPLLDAIGLPYKNPGMYMYLILPKAHGINNLKKLLSHLNVNSLKKLKSESVNEEIIIIIPKINIDVQYSLTKPLNQAGLSAIFNPSQANFANLAVNVSVLFLSKFRRLVAFLLLYDINVLFL